MLSYLKGMILATKDESVLKIYYQKSKYCSRLNVERKHIKRQKYIQILAIA